MIESGLSADSVAVVALSAAVLVPMVIVIAGCAFCRKLCRGNDPENEERRPLLDDNKREQQTTTVTIETNSEYHDQDIETGQRGSEAALIPDLLITEEQRSVQEHFVKTHDAFRPVEPDILEPRPARDQSQRQNEPKDIEHRDNERDKRESAMQQNTTEDFEKENKAISKEEKLVEPITEPEQHLIAFGEQDEHINSFNKQTVTTAPSNDQGEITKVTNEYETPIKLVDGQEQTMKPVDEYSESKIPVNEEEKPAKAVDEDSESRKPVNEQVEPARTVDEHSESTKPVNEEDEPTKPVDEHSESKKPINEQDEPGKTIDEHSELRTPVTEQEESPKSTHDHEEPKVHEKTEVHHEEDAEKPSGEPVTASVEVKKTEDENEEKGEIASTPVQPDTPAAGIEFEATFVKRVQTKAARKDMKAIFGLTALQQELFVINQHSPDVEVYDSNTMTFKYQFHLEGLFDPVDICSCSVNSCLYIFDWVGETNEILRVDTSGKLITKWSTGGDGGFLSITPEANVLLSAWERNTLVEYTADGELIREIQLSSTISELKFGVKIANRSFIISHGEDEDSQHRVCLIDETGAEMKSFGGSRGSSNNQFNCPNYIVVDAIGFVFVADQNNKRVILLSPALEFKNELFQESDGLRYPVRLDLDRTSGRLFIADNDYLLTEKTWRDGKINVFDLKLRQTS